MSVTIALSVLPSTVSVASDSTSQSGNGVAVSSRR